MSLVKSGVFWVRQSVAWSNSWHSWQERLVLLAFLLVGVGLGFLSTSINPWTAVGLWCFYALGLVVCSQQGWLKLFGPVLFYDMVCTARRSRYLVIRLLYAVLLLGILIVMFLEFGSHQRDPRLDSALIAQAFFSAFMIVQLGMVMLLTPAYVAGAIAEEKDRKTLEFMLATDLNNREIVLSKLLSRLGNMTLLLITGLPILSILQFMGGVDPELLLAGFAATGLTMVGVASLGILMSTLFQKPRDAIGLTYLIMISYCALATTTMAMDKAGAPWMKEHIWFGDWSPTWNDVSGVLNMGNPIAAVVEIKIAMDRATLNAVVPEVLSRYAAFYAVMPTICVVWSIWRLRAIALEQAAGGGWFDRLSRMDVAEVLARRRAKQAEQLAVNGFYRPPIGDLPMMWKELYVEGRTRLNWLAWVFVVLLVVLTIGSGLFIVGYQFWTWAVGGDLNWRDFTSAINWWFRLAGTGVGCLMILMVAVRASTSVSEERERGTLDALITTPMDADGILSAKLLGCITSLRMGWLWFGSMLAIAVLSGGVHLLAVPLLIVEWFVYATFVAMVGIGFSMSCKSSMRATVYTVLTTLMLGGGHWMVMALCCYFPALAMGGPGWDGRLLEYIFKFQLGMTPPFVLGLSAYSWSDIGREFNRDFRDFIGFSLVGLFLWTMGSVILWFGILLPKFRLMTRREELIYQ
ncbi:MAG TPA: ABC transporter permease subunit [Gemmataceae bacterium]|nr:ABC transporter permease subunit [Gemmataceae bacterium]